jgi:glycine oxidase
MDSTDVIVVGGGLIGCLAARELRADGLSVRIVDRSLVGREASYHAAGMLAPQSEAEEDSPMFRIALQSARLFPGLAEDLYNEVGIDVRFRSEGTFHVAFEDAELENFQELVARQHAVGLTAEIIGPELARREEPALSEEIIGVLSFPEDHQIDNRRLMEAVVASCKKRKVDVVEQAPARELIRDQAGRVCGVSTTAGEFAAGTVVMAAGCWSSLVKGFDVPVEPVKGQILLLELMVPPFRRVLRSADAYLVARLDGRVLIGATMERVGYDKTVSAQAVGALLESARQMVPSLTAAFGGEAWAGLRPATPDGMPAIGWLDEGLMSATGHFRNGILLAPITAQMVADQLSGRPPHPDLPAFDPRRFRGSSQVD